MEQKQEIEDKTIKLNKDLAIQNEYIKLMENDVKSKSEEIELLLVIYYYFLTKLYDKRPRLKNFNLKSNQSGLS